MIDGAFSYRWFCWAIFPRIYEKYFRASPTSKVSKIGTNNELFYSYCAGLSDAEGNWQADSLHREKLDRMKFVLEHRTPRDWSAIEKSWQALRRAVAEEVKLSKELARMEYDIFHQVKLGK